MRAFAFVDLDAISDNIAAIKKLTSAKILAVVKADAYGHGLVPVGLCAIESGAEWLGVALLEEALELRAAGITAPIIAWLTPPGEDFESAISSEIDLSVSSIALFSEILEWGSRLSIKPRIHIEIDTGMRRGGVLDEWDEFLQFTVEHKDRYELIGFWSHFARADEPDSEFNEAQRLEFERALSQVRECGLRPEIVHLSNSAATLADPEAHHQMIRLGIAMYGLSPDLLTMGPVSDFQLRPAMTVRAQLILVKAAQAGDAVGYGGTAILPRDTRLGVVVMGYSDGLPRNTSSGAGVTHGDTRAPLVGRISMDQCVVDLGADSLAEPGDYVTVFGSDGYSIDEWASASGTINYEIVTRIATRVPRLYSEFRAGDLR
jgi:alanine racemase